MTAGSPSPRATRVSRVPPHAAFLASVFASGLAVLTLLRAVFWLAVRGGEPPVPPGALLRAFATGVRFDASVSAWLLAAPLLALAAARLAGLRSRLLDRAVTWAIGAGYALVFLIAAADIPWYRRFGSRIVSGALDWADTPRFFLDSTVGDPGNLPYLALFLATAALFGLLLGRLRVRFLERDGAGEGSRAREALALAAWSLGAIALLLVAARGRIAQSSPIRTGTAFSSPYPLANQLGLNPAFTFWDSALEARSDRARHVPLAPAEEAIEATRRLLGAHAPSGFASPVARRVEPPGPERDWNVVIVLMEGMGAGRLARFGGDGSTPRLDDLAANGWSFDRIYAAGLHTYAGVYATLFSMPTLPGEHPMKGARALRAFGGIARTLAERGYRTAFLCPHDAQIDNMGGFLANNGYETLLDLDDWPREAVLPNLRVPDHALFDLAIPALRGLASGGRPFLAAILTVSNHPRFYLPEGIPFRPRSADPETRMVEYADWSIGRFLDAAAREPWFERTLFVLIADHGSASTGETGDGALARHHVPLVLYAPSLLREPRALDALGTQADVGPTVLGLLGRPWVDTTLGSDLLASPKPFVALADDDAVVAYDGESAVVTRRGGGGSATGPAGRDRAAAARLRDEALSYLETARTVVDRNLAGPAGAKPAR